MSLYRFVLEAQAVQIEFIMAEDFEEQELIDRIGTWWRENGISLVGTLVLVVGGWSGWNFYASYSQEQAQKAFGHLAEYVELRVSGEGDSERALKLLALLDDEHQGSADQLLSHFYRAHDAMEAGAFDTAREHLSHAIQNAPGGHLEGLARLRLARVYIEQGEAQMALELLAEVEGPGFLAMRDELRGDAYWQLEDQSSAHESYQSALAHQQQDSNVDTWPFLKMKIAGLDFSEQTQAKDDAQEMGQLHDQDQAGESIANVAETSPATHIEVVPAPAEHAGEEGMAQLSSTEEP